jgi:hypothetical protein
MSNPISDQMTAIWNAIDNYADLQSQFSQKYKLDENMPDFTEDDDPKFADYPAIMVLPSSEMPDWYLNKQMKIVTAFEIWMWTEKWAYSQAADLLQKLRLAFWKASASVATPSYIKTCTGYHPISFSSIRYKRVVVGERGSQRALKTTAVLTLQTNDDPLA